MNRGTFIKLIFIYLSLLMPVLSCASANAKKEPVSFRFAFLSNTNPSSPFTGYPEFLPAVIEKINGENPLFVIHAGNIVHGGYDWMGIKEWDMDRQFRKFYQSISGIQSVLFTAAGEKDYYNGTTGLYKKYTGRKDYYSFNYGPVHFIILKTTTGIPEIIDSTQLKWLRNDLALNRHSEAIFIISHHPVYRPDKNGVKASGNDNLNRMLHDYPVKALISAGEDFTMVKSGKTDYITAPCRGYEDYTRERGGARLYYIIDFDGTAVKVAEKNL